MSKNIVKVSNAFRREGRSPLKIVPLWLRGQEVVSNAFRREGRSPRFERDGESRSLREVSNAFRREGRSPLTGGTDKS